MNTLMWFREDLRLFDNPALSHACVKGHCIAVFCITPLTWREHNMSPIRLQFLVQGLQQLQKDLAKKNIALQILKLNTFEDSPNALLSFIKKYKISHLFYNMQYELNEIQRDENVKTLCAENNIDVSQYHEQCILPPGTLLNKKGEAYKVYTPFKKACWQTFYKQGITACFSLPKKQTEMLGEPTKGINELVNLNSNAQLLKNWPAGEAHAEKRLRYFIENHLLKYHDYRDYPCIDGTSKLSAYFSAGMLSVRHAYLSAMEYNLGEFATGQQGSVTWMNELLWRDFYRHILFAYPRVCRNKAFNQATQRIKWNDNKNHLQAWQQGQTGIPIVDAAMRQLNQTGWMHNRCRMIVAMFLTKNLFIDWREGEKYFSQTLIDGDLASNNGGWQWSASTGVDAVPYFRIFNPVRQSMRFDAKGEYIKAYCKELSCFDAKACHEPYKMAATLAAKQNYPKPIVDLKQSRQRAIKIFKELM